MDNISTNQVEMDMDKAKASQYRKAVREGDPKAMVQLGIMYVTGKGVSKNLERAENYFQRAANAGISDGWLWLGKIYSKDSSKDSLACYEKAAALGNEEAIQNLKRKTEDAYDSELQQGISDYRKFKRTGRVDKLVTAFHCFVRLAQCGHNQSIDQVIFLLENEKDSEKTERGPISLFDDDKAILTLVIQAVKQENTNAIYYLGLIYQEGLYGVKKNLDKAFELYSKASEQGHSKAMRSIGNLYAKGYGDLDEEDEEKKVMEWCLRATKENDAWGFYYIGKYYDEERDDFATALEWYERSLTSFPIPSTIEETADMLTSEWPYAFYIESKLGSIMSMHSARSFMCYLGDRCKSIKSKKKWYEMSARNGSVAGKKSLNDILEREYEKTKVAKIVKNTNDIASKILNSSNMPLEALRKLSKDSSLTPEQREIYQKALEKKREHLVAERDRQRSTRNPGESCFITTAVFTSLGKPDDCYELTAFRKFRDYWLRKEPDGKTLIDRYYVIAPQIVQAINQRPNVNEIYRFIWNTYLRSCLQYIETGNYKLCKKKYISMVDTLAHKFIT